MTHRKRLFMMPLVPALIMSANLAAMTLPQAGDPPLNEILTDKEYRNYLNKDNYKKRMDIFRDAFTHYTSELRNRLHKKQTRDVKEILLKMRAISHYAIKEPARALASPKDLRSGQVKKLEIRLRKLLASLHDMMLSVPYEYRPDFETTEDDLENLRNQLLQQLFY